MGKTQGVVKALLNTSFIIVLVFLLLFLYFNTPYGQEIPRWKEILNGYLLALAVIMPIGILVTPEIMRQLAKAQYWKSLAFRFLPSAFITFAILILFRGFFQGPDAINPLSIITYVPIPILLLHAFAISQIEEILFRGVLCEAILKKSKVRTAYIITAFVFAIFHFFTSGGSFIIMATYIPLSLAWTYLKFNGYPYLNKIPKAKNLFGSTRATQQSNAGSHFAWNLFILGFVRPMGT